MTDKTFNTIQQLLKSPIKVVIIPHQNPDGDAIGASLALVLFLKGLGHQATVVSPNDYPKFLKWMPDSDKVMQFEQHPKKASALINEAQLIFILDFNALNRTGEAMTAFLESLKTPIMMIDHHQQPDDFTDLIYSDTAICSTCQMVYQFIEKLNHLDKIDAAIATCLYTGIMTDTGSFKYRSTTSTTHRIIADLIDKGANNNDIHNHVYDTNTYNGLQLLGRALSNLRVVSDYNTAYITISEAEKSAFNFSKGDTEGFVNYGLSIDKIVFAVIFIEDASQGIIKMSLRSKGNFSVNQFARKHFNGGGHDNAAGGKSHETLEATVQTFLSILPLYKLDLTKNEAAI